ncbi:hypothetical protein AA0111_g5574 [Alternaria arborescens]|uniref:hypothetical protein n=1 Tax=Alternaria arborescens TaxID=156630 RepID=UPI0010757A5E|nr:hypothetical protein AA0111_g5574 [Alternaria arborescens]RYO30217.1 hypothetical protein AA0111_g5574 [Alternaria arborescens]
MPPIQTNVEPSEELWFAFRQKHNAELYDFQQKSKQAYETVLQNINKAKSELLAKHKKEEEEFWTEARAASKDKSKSANKSAASKTRTQGRNNRQQAAPPTRKAAPEPKRTQAVTSKAPQTSTPTPAYNTKTQARQSKKRSVAVTIIDLCSDDDEPVKEQKKLDPPPIAKDPILESQKSDIIETAVRREHAIPSASLELFDKSAKQGTPEPSLFKREQDLFTAQPPTLVNPSPIASHDASIAAPSIQHSSIPKGGGFGRWVSASGLHMPATQTQKSLQGSAWTFGAPVSRTLDNTSACTFSAVSTWATPTISASEVVQLSSGLAPSRPPLHHQSGSLRPQQSVDYRQGQTLEPSAEDTLMHEPPRTPPRPQQYIPNMPPPPRRSSHTPDALTQSSMAPKNTSFRRPDFPASVTKDSMRAARNVRAGSQASASTYRASSITQSQCDLSATPRTSVSSLCLGRRKRKAIDVSSDESDDTPPSEDDEPRSSVIIEELCKSVKGNVEKFGPVTKKTKFPPPPPPAIASKGVFSKGKNGYGFQPTSRPKSEVDYQAALSLPNQPQHASIMKSQLSPPTTTTPALKKPTKPIATTRAVPVSRSPRKAKLDASAKISQLSETELRIRNDIAVDEANGYEAPETGVVEQVRGSMRSMSITPAPNNTEDQGITAENVGMLADLSDTESTIAVQSTKHGAGWNSWTHSRINGDRNLAKLRPNRPLVQDEDDDDDDPDISKYSIIDGLIVHEADLERLRLTQEQDRQNLMKSRKMGGGDRARVVSATEIP